MLKRLKPYWLEIALAIIVVLGAVLVVSQFQANTKARLANAKLDTQVRAADATLSQSVQETDLQNLRQNVQQVQLALAQASFPDEKGAVAATDRISQAVKTNGVNITKWNTNYTSDILNDKKFSAIGHVLNVDGNAAGLTGFVKDLTTGAQPSVVRNLTMNYWISEEASGWRMTLEVLFFYR